MRLSYDRSELLELMKDFHLLTGIRIVLFDPNFTALLSYPPEDCAFCRGMKGSPATRRLCEKSDRASFQRCKQENRLILSRCHAGLVEAAAPLCDRGSVIGYMMFGQITDSPESALPDISFKTPEQIRAAAKIMEACAVYVLLKKAVSLQRSGFRERMEGYLRGHLAEDLSVSALTAAFGMGKTALYQTFSDQFGCTVAEYVRSLRIEEAKRLLRETDRPITRIAGDVGFGDYNYFCRCMKKSLGMSARTYRESQRG